MNYHAIVNLLFEKGLLKKIPITIPLQDLHLLICLLYPLTHAHDEVW